MVEENQWIYQWKTSKPLGNWWRKTERFRWLVEKTSWPMLRRKNRKVGENRGVGKIEKSNCGAERSGITWLWKSFACYWDRIKNEIKTGSSGLFSAHASATIFCRPALLLFGAWSLSSRLGCRPCHRWKRVYWRRSCCRLLRIVTVEGTDEFAKV